MTELSKMVYKIYNKSSIRTKIFKLFTDGNIFKFSKSHVHYDQRRHLLTGLLLSKAACQMRWLQQFQTSLVLTIC
jgi:hypothetical protein